MLLSDSFGLVAGVLMALSSIVYFMQVFNGKSEPNPVSWGIWFFVSIINSFTYFTVVNHNVWQALFAITNSFAIFTILTYTLLKGVHSKIRQTDLLVVLLTIVVSIFWQITSSDRFANLLLQAIYVISYIPTISGVLSKNAKEHYMAWLITVIASLFATLSVLTNYPGDWVSIVNPLIIGVICNSLVLVLILTRRKITSH
ncbi:MAG: hypothetical protein WC897_04140 [Candidatus Gracilibacteria bacterium]